MRKPSILWFEIPFTIVILCSVGYMWYRDDKWMGILGFVSLIFIVLVLFLLVDWIRKKFFRQGK